MNRLTQLALGKRSVTLLLAAALFVAGIIAWGSLKQELLPDVSFPIVTVIAPYPGAGAADVAEQVTKPIERAGLRRRRASTSCSRRRPTRSRSSSPSSSTGPTSTRRVATIEENLRSAGLPTRRRRRPSGPSTSAPRRWSSPRSRPTGSRDLERRRRDRPHRDLARARGAARRRHRGPRRWLEEPARRHPGPGEARERRRLDPAGQRRPPGEQPDLPGRRAAGRTARGSRSRRSAASSRSTTIAELVVGVRRPPSAPGATPVRRSARPRRSRSSEHRHRRGRERRDDRLRADQRPARRHDLGQQGEHGQHGDRRAGRRCRSSRRSPRATRARSSVAAVSDQSSFILESSEGLLREGGLGAMFAVLTIFLFLFNLRSTLVAAVSIPLSILTALVVMQVAGITLNIMTLGGLAVAVGRVVDDSIVVLENIYRHRALGDDRLTAVDQGAARGRRGDHRQHVDDGRGLPAARLRRRLRQPVLPAVLADGHLRPARVADRRADRRARARLPARGSGQAARSTRPASQRTRSGSAPTTRHPLRRSEADGRSSGRSRSPRSCSSPRSASCASLPTAFINSGSEKIVQVSVSPPSGATSEQVLDRAAIAARPSCSTIRTSNSSPPACPARTTSGSRPSSPPSSAGPPTARRLIVRLDPSVDLETKIEAMVEQPRRRRRGWLRGHRRPAGRRHVEQRQRRRQRGGSRRSSPPRDRTPSRPRSSGSRVWRTCRATSSRRRPEIQVRVDPNKALGGRPDGGPGRRRDPGGADPTHRRAGQARRR